MSHKLASSFSFVFQTDGESTSIAIDLASAPVTLSPPAPAASATDAIELCGDWGGPVTKASLEAGVLTLNFTPPKSGVHAISGRLLF